MHSRVFQISSQPIEKEDYIREGDFYDLPFLGEVADYVSEDTNKSDDIEWLKNCYQNGVEITEDIIVITDKKKFFEDSFERFKETLKKLEEETTIEAFAGVDKSKYGFGSNIYELKCLAEGDKFGFYMFDFNDCGYPETFDEFVRGAEEGKTYYIGATFDYHS